MTNFADRTIWTGDNLDVLRRLNSSSVDLIYLNLQLLCGHYNSVKGDRPQEYLVARLRELGIAA